MGSSYKLTGQVRVEEFCGFVFVNLDPGAQSLSKQSGDLETEVRRMLDFCGVPFEEACLNFHKTERSVRTPSSEQVRQPIYRSGLDLWRNYRPHLDELVDALGDDVMRRYPPD